MSRAGGERRRRPRTLTEAGTREAVRQARRAARAGAAWWERGVAWFGRRAFSENAILLGFAVAIGVATALGVVGFYKLIDLAYLAFFEWPTAYLPHRNVELYRPLLTAAALALAWTIMRRAGRGSDGLTVPDVQLAVVRRGGAIATRPALARTAASAVTLGGGGSAGSEGPVAVLGAALGSALGRLFRFSPERVVVLVGAGAAAGISAAFNAPLAGAFFALEEILGSLSVAAFPPVVVSSVVAAVVSRAVFGNHPAFPIPREYGYLLVREVALFYPLLGVLCGVVSAAFVRTYFAVGDAVRALAARHRVPATAVPWVAGALVGGMVLASGGLLVGAGHLAIPLAAFGGMAWYALAMLAVGKILATAVTLQGGGSGGLFTPSVYVGAATGGAFGAVLRTIFPALGLAPEAYALVGMGAVIAGATGAPITGILLVFEMTNDYAIVLPLMIAVVVSNQVARRLEPDNLYSGWLRRRGERIEHGAARDVLAGLRVADALDREAVVIAEAEPLSRVLDHIGNRDQTIFPVVDGDGLLLGVLTTADLGAVARHDHVLGEVVLAADVVQESETLAPGDSLLRAVRLMGVRGASALPVVDPPSGRLLGVVNRSHVLTLYEQAVATTSRTSDAPPH